MASVTEICNLALRRARVEVIGDIDEDSAEARECKILYGPARDYILELYAWRFAKKTVALADTGNSPTEWSYEYGYPNDCLRINYLLPPGVGQSILKNQVGSIEFDPQPYEVGMRDDDTDRVIRSTPDDAYIAYTSKVTNPDMFSGTFSQAISWHMAADLAIVFGGDSGQGYRRIAIDEFGKRLAEATTLDVDQSQKVIRRLPRNLAARSDSVPSHYYYNGQLFRRY
jgi:hypothetical protein